MSRSFIRTMIIGALMVLLPKLSLTFVGPTARELIWSYIIYVHIEVMNQENIY
jgi:hypothetical protein